MNIKISVIIPVYNCEKYLEEAMTSLLQQTLKECEFIFINDGSKDNSLIILERFKKLDSRILIVNQRNKGVSEARNKGLSLAKGEYIGFIDGDDYIKPDMYENLYYIAKKNSCDIVISNFESEQEGIKSVSNYPFKKEEILNKYYIEKNIYTYFLKEEGFNSVCNKIFLNKLIKEKNIKFPKGVALGEDGVFNMKFFTHCNNAFYINYCGYYYREVQGSATRNVKNKDYFKRSLDVYEYYLEEWNNWNINNEDIKKLKSIKLLTSVLSYTYVYFNSYETMSFSNRYNYVKGMIANKKFRESLKYSFNEVYISKGRYEKFILKMININCVLGIFLATFYSRVRSEKRGGK